MWLYADEFSLFKARSSLSQLRQEEEKVGALVIDLGGTQRLIDDSRTRRTPPGPVTRDSFRRAAVPFPEPVDLGGHSNDAVGEIWIIKRF